MMRLLYMFLLRLHPPYFRQRFAEEMLCIFDQAAKQQSAVRLLADALVSLIRQWILRSDFWEQPLAAEGAQPASQGVPVFYTFRNSRLSLGALINGGILSLATFSAVSYAFVQGRSHPPISALFAGSSHGGYSPALAIRRPAISSAGGVQSTKVRIALNPGTNSVWSRLLLLLGAPTSSRSEMQPALPGTPAARQLHAWLLAFNAGDFELLRSYAGRFENAVGDPSAADNSARTWVEWLGRLGTFEIRKVERSSPHEIIVLAQTRNGFWWRLRLELSAEKPNSISQLRAVSFGPEKPSAPVKLSDEQLRTYVGTYIAEPPNEHKIRIMLERGELNMEVLGQSKTALVAVSDARFFAVGVTNRWIEFTRNEAGKVEHLHLYQSGQQLKARRVQ